MSAGKKFYAKQIDKALASAKEINQEEHPRIVVFATVTAETAHGTTAF